VRSLVATLIGADAGDMVLAAGVSGAVATVAAQLPTAADARANVVLPARDLTSGFASWALLTERGYELRPVDDTDGVLATDAFAGAVDGHTAVIAGSFVQSATGYRLDIDALKELGHGTDSWLIIDASQALGAIDIDVDGIDVLLSCSHTWALGMRGLGHLYVRPELRDTFDSIRPAWKATDAPTHGFYGPVMALSFTASKSDASSPWLNPIVDVEGLRIIDTVGTSAIEAHNMGLVDEMESRGITVPFERASRSSIVSLDVADADAAISALDVEDIVASAYAGRVRVSMHLYNTVADIDRLVAAVSPFVKDREGSDG